MRFSPGSCLCRPYGPPHSSCNEYVSCLVGFLSVSVVVVSCRQSLVRRATLEPLALEKRLHGTGVGDLDWSPLFRTRHVSSILAPKLIRPRDNSLSISRMLPLALHFLDMAPEKNSEVRLVNGSVRKCRGPEGTHPCQVGQFHDTRWQTAIVANHMLDPRTVPPPLRPFIGTGLPK